MEKQTKLAKKITHKTKQKLNLSYHNGVYDEEFVVSGIVDKKFEDGIPFYKVRWHGFPDSQCTWEPVKHLTNVLEMVKEFDKIIAAKTGTATSTGDEDNSNQDKSSKNMSRTNSFKNCTSAPKRVIGGEKDSEASNACSVHVKEEVKIEEGKLEKDVPEKIVAGKKVDKKIMCTLSWKARDDGIVPANSECCSNDLKDRYPNLLLDFYESRLNFYE